ncbi:MAG: hypothetical protein ACK5FE_01845 [Cyanobacteriota bacterium]|jgi:hypothetical protein
MNTPRCNGMRWRHPGRSAGALTACPGESLVQQVEPEGLWLFGSWARGTASRRSDMDPPVVGLEHCRVLDAYDAVLEALKSCRLPLQPLVACRT